jgi:DNA-directed RNA polymerase subunit RPC12/RpoP
MKRHLTKGKKEIDWDASDRDQVSDSEPEHVESDEEIYIDRSSTDREMSWDEEPQQHAAAKYMPPPPPPSIFNVESDDELAMSIKDMGDRQVTDVLSCCWCHRPFETALALFIHQDTDHRRTVYQCPYCNSHSRDSLIAKKHCLKEHGRNQNSIPMYRYRLEKKLVLKTADDKPSALTTRIDARDLRLHRKAQDYHFDDPKSLLFHCRYQ